MSLGIYISECEIGMSSNKSQKEKFNDEVMEIINDIAPQIIGATSNEELIEYLFGFGESDRIATGEKLKAIVEIDLIYQVREALLELEEKYPAFRNYLY